MQIQFQYIIDLAKQYETYNKQSGDLFTAINHLPQHIVEEIYEEYGDPDRGYKPVNLIRAEIARRLLQGESASEALVNEIKDKIRTKDIAYFSHCKDVFLKQIEESKPFKKDLFTAWQNPWGIFHVFFYRGPIKETVQNYLEQIAKDLLNQLDLNDYTFHHVDFQGASNFGSDLSWLALYPITKSSHKGSYQFFIGFKSLPEVGRCAGSDLVKPNPNKFKQVGSYSETITYLQELKDEIVKLNKESKNYFKFSPGSQASEWSRFYDEGIAGVDYSEFHLKDISTYNSLAELNETAGLPTDSQSNKTWNLWLFKTAKIGDVIFANKGVNTCLGIGVIENDYYYDENADTG